MFQKIDLHPYNFTHIEWNNTRIPKNVTHIHGNKDKLLPAKLNNVQYTVKDGGHFMIFEKAEEINRIIIDTIKTE